MTETPDALEHKQQMFKWLPPLRRMGKALALACGLEATGNVIRPWDEPGDFRDIWLHVRERTLVDQRRCFLLYRTALQCSSLPGAAAEVGVYRGGTAYVLSRTLGQRDLYLFDTFSGMPPVKKGLDLHQQGDFGDTSLAAVRAFLGSESAVLIPGEFPHSASGLEGQRFAMVHVDCDIYSSVRACCEWFYPRLVTGGLMVFDDYGVKSCPGARRAVDEFFEQKPEVPLWTGRGQAIVFRTGA